MQKPCKVLIDNQEAVLEEARVSMYPFNRHWPGHQRALEQTEICGFVSFDVEEKEREVRILCDFDFETVTVKPLSLNIRPQIHGREISFKVSKPCQAVVEFDDTFGALHLFANPKELPSDNGCETISFGKGVHHVGRIELKSNQRIYLEEGAVVYGEIYGCDVCNVEISGRGILDHSWQESFEITNDFIDPLRPSPIEIRYSRNVVIKDIVVRDPFFLAVRPIGCEGLLIDNIKVIGCWRYNSDGIDLLNCRNGEVRNCFVRSFDDSICLKGFCSPYINEMYHNGIAYNRMENITISNCVVWNEWGKALEIGIDICADEVSNCKFINCDVIHGTNSVMDIGNLDYANIHDITFENIRVECEHGEMPIAFQTGEEEVYSKTHERAYPYLSTVQVFYDSNYSFKGDVRGRIHDILFKDIYVYADRMLKSDIFGFSEVYNVDGITYENIRLNGKPLRTAEECAIRVGKYATNVNVVSDEK